MNRTSLKKNLMEKFYVTTAIPYVNAKPHVGHALEFVQADTIARYHRLKGKNVALLSGSDENALKNVQAAEEAGQSVQQFVDENTKLFQLLIERLNIKIDFFQKGSSKQHYKWSQELWKKCNANGDIYKKDYKGFYCIGCELFYEKEELNQDGECYEHPGKKLQEVSESNYFFRLSNYQNQIINLLRSDELKITPVSRKNEMLSFLEKGLEDISISRSNERAKNWGVPVPDDESQRIYVWFDALNIYRSGLGEKYEEFWPADVHVIGKGITRFHAIYWPAFLLSAGIPLPKSIFVHGYFTVDGQKMSKTLGNVIDPIDLIDKYGADALRYYLLSQIPSTEDGDFSEDKLKRIYNSDLANGLGNLVARIAKLCEKTNRDFPLLDENKLYDRVTDAIKEYRFDRALEDIWTRISVEDGNINKTEPWNKEGEELYQILLPIVAEIRKIAFNLQPFLPDTAKKILEQYSERIKSGEPLFPRKS